MVAERERPHPTRSYWRGSGVEDATDNNAIGQHVEIVLLPLPGGFPAAGVRSSRYSRLKKLFQTWCN